VGRDTASLASDEGRQDGKGESEDGEHLEVVVG
jgi:hypothetical protein